MLSPLPKLPERKTLAELGVERREFVELLGAKAERLFFTYRFLMTTELNEFLEKMSRAGIENIVEEGDIGFKIILENGDEFVLEYPDSMHGITPHIGLNGNWFIGDTDTGVKAEGVDGQDGQDGADGYAPIKGVDYFDGEKGEKGEKGEQGTGLDFDWDGTKLGVKKEDDPDFDYTDLTPDSKTASKAEIKGTKKANVTPTTKAETRTTARASTSVTSRAGVKNTDKALTTPTGKAATKATTKAEVLDAELVPVSSIPNYEVVSELPATIPEGKIVKYNGTFWAGLLEGESSLAAGTPWPVKGYKEITQKVTFSTLETIDVINELGVSITWQDYSPFLISEQQITDLVDSGSVYNINCNPIDSGGNLTVGVAAIDDSGSFGIDLIMIRCFDIKDLTDPFTSSNALFTLKIYPPQ